MVTATSSSASGWKRSSLVSGTSPPSPQAASSSAHRTMCFPRIPSILRSAGRELAVDSARQVAADGDRLADHLPHVLERVDARAAVVDPRDGDLGDAVAA